MKKTLKLLVILLLLLCLCFILIILSISNAIYDYTLNPSSSKNISERIPVDHLALQKARIQLQKCSEDVYVQCDDLKLHGYFITQKSSIYMIMVHGYRSEGASLLAPILEMRKSYNVLIPDLRGHGQSEGDYIGMGCDDREDIFQWIEFILKKDSKAKIILYGVSMGAATVMNMSGEQLPHQVKGIIEDCGYSSVGDLFQNYFQMNDFQRVWFMRLASVTTLMRAGYLLGEVEPIQQVKKSQTPILFIHGDQDGFVPVSMVNELYQSAKCPKEKLIIHGAKHADSYRQDQKRYYQTIHQFIKKTSQK